MLRFKWQIITDVVLNLVINSLTALICWKYQREQHWSEKCCIYNWYITSYFVLEVIRLFSDIYILQWNLDLSESQTTSCTPTTPNSGMSKSTLNVFKLSHNKSSCSIHVHAFCQLNSLKRQYNNKRIWGVSCLKINVVGKEHTTCTKLEKDWISIITHCGMMVPYGGRLVGQHHFR